MTIWIEGNLPGILREDLSVPIAIGMVWQWNARIRFRPDEVYQWPCGPGATSVEDAEHFGFNRETFTGQY